MAGGEASLRRTRRHPIAAAAGVLLLVPMLVVFGARDAVWAWYALPPWWVRTVDQRHPSGARWTLDDRRDPSAPGDRFRLEINGRSELELDEHTIRLGPTAGGRTPPAGAVDLDYDSVDELVVTAFSGGAHCCETVYIYQLTTPPRLVAKVEAGNGMAVYGRGARALFCIPDQTFDYWNAPHSASPQPEVYYTIRDGRLRVELDYMTMAVLGRNRIGEGAASEIRAALAKPGSDLDPRMWTRMLDLMYSGLEPLAWRFFDECWPAERPGKEEFRREFVGMLEKSPQWRDVRDARAAAARGEPPPWALVGRPTPTADPAPAAPATP